MKYLILVITLLLTGCMGPGKFTVKQSPSDIVQGGTETIYTSSNNRVSDKNPKGDYYAYSDGLYLNPFSAKDKGESIIGLEVQWKTTRTTVAGLNGANPAEIGSLIKIEIKADGKLLLYKLTNQDFTSGGLEFNQYSNDASIGETFSATTNLSKSDYQAIMNSTELMIKVIGTRGEFSYAEKLLRKEFRENLKSFYINNT